MKSSARISGFSDFPVELVFELPEEETAEEKPNMGLVKLKDLPAVDGYSSAGLRRNRFGPVVTESGERSPRRQRGLPSGKRLQFAT